MIFPCLPLLALIIARLLCSSLIFIPAKRCTQMHLQVKIFTTHLFNNSFYSIRLLLDIIHSGCLYCQWKEFGWTHRSLGPPWLCASPWQTLLTTSACPQPSCSKAHRPTPGWRRDASAERSSGSARGLCPARQERPPPPSGPCPAVHGSEADLCAGRLFYRRPADDQIGRSCAAAFCLAGRFESAHRSGSTPSCAPARRAPVGQHIFKDIQFITTFIRGCD